MTLSLARLGLVLSSSALPFLLGCAAPITEARPIGNAPKHPAEARTTVLLFVSHECPISNAYSPEINRLCAEYGSRGVSFRLVYPDPELDAATAAKHAADFGYTCPAVLDPEHELVERWGAKVVPEAAVLSPAGELVYRGRIDDSYPTLGKRRPAPTQTDLRDALEAVLAGRPVAVPRTEAVGCYIERPRK